MALKTGTLEEKGIKPCIADRKSCGSAHQIRQVEYKRRNRIEIMFGHLKNWRRAATRYDKFPNIFVSTICLVATIMF
ncbi:transposase [Gluconobacter thailandicus]|uniref:Transposase n=1 Tax=Gluconobacter thailandicus TaxID=257438 RepID=A0AAP9EUQ5_GLUTH|nr:transposase [Gluconobacter thailandicus]